MPGRRRPAVLSCSVWRQAAENVAESLHPRRSVVVTGRLKQRSYETREGEKRTVFELDVDEIGPSFGTPRQRSPKSTAVRRRFSNAQQPTGGSDRGHRSGAKSRGGQAAADPWSGQRSGNHPRRLPTSRRSRSFRPSRSRAQHSDRAPTPQGATTMAKNTLCASRRRRSAHSVRTGSSTSITRTPVSFGSTSLIAARSGPGA